jgi:hypothetical protein
MKKTAQDAPGTIFSSGVATHVSPLFEHVRPHSNGSCLPVIGTFRTAEDGVDAAVPVDAKNAPTATCKTAKNAVSHKRPHRLSFSGNEETRRRNDRTEAASVLTQIVSTEGFTPERSWNRARTVMAQRRVRTRLSRRLRDGVSLQKARGAFHRALLRMVAHVDDYRRGERSSRVRSGEHAQSEAGDSDGPDAGASEAARLLRVSVSVCCQGFVQRPTPACVGLWSWSSALSVSPWAPLPAPGFP